MDLRNLDLAKNLAKKPSKKMMNLINLLKKLPPKNNLKIWADLKQFLKPPNSTMNTRILLKFLTMRTLKIRKLKISTINLSDWEDSNKFQLNNSKKLTLFQDWPQLLLPTKNLKKIKNPHMPNLSMLMLMRILKLRTCWMNSNTKTN